MLDAYEKGFISAFIDTDGSICLNKVKNRKTPQIAVYFSNNSIELLEKVRDMIGLDRPLIHHKGTKNYSLRYFNKKASELLKQVELVVKEKRRKAALELADYLESQGGRKMNQHTKPKGFDEKVRDIVESFY